MMIKDIAGKSPNTSRRMPEQFPNDNRRMPEQYPNIAGSESDERSRELWSVRYLSLQVRTIFKYSNPQIFKLHVSLASGDARDSDACDTLSLQVRTIFKFSNPQIFKLRVALASGDARDSN
jgi:hypothetical protein